AVVAAAPPRNGTAPSISGIAQEQATLTAAVGTWTGTGTLTYDYQWSRCDLTGLACTALAGATSSTYVAQAADVGSTLRVAVTPRKACGSSTASSDPTPTAVVDVAAPANSVLPALSGTAQDGTALETTAGDWVGTGPITVAYQWQRCDATGTVCADLS